MSAPNARRLRSLALALVVSLSLVGCKSVNGPHEENADEEHAEENAAAVLNFFETELVGLWSRFHSYDGSTEYIRFNANRTACKWEEANGSNSRLKRSSYDDWRIDENDASDDDWRIDENDASDYLEIVVQGAGIRWFYDYPDDVIWPASYRSSLARYRTSSGKTCEG